MKLVAEKNMFRMSKGHVELRFVFYTHIYNLKCLYTWNPNGAHCFEWSLGLLLDGFKNRGPLGSRYANVLDESFLLNF